MTVSPLAGRLPDPSSLIDVDALVAAYYEHAPDPSVDEQRVSFGTSGHRGSSPAGTFNEAHVLAISEAVCRYRRSQGIDGPLFLGRDTPPKACHDMVVIDVVEAALDVPFDDPLIGWTRPILLGLLAGRTDRVADMLQSIATRLPRPEAVRDG